MLVCKKIFEKMKKKIFFLQIGHSTFYEIGKVIRLQPILNQVLIL